MTGSLAGSQCADKSLPERRLGPGLESLLGLTNLEAAVGKEPALLSHPELRQAGKRMDRLDGSPHFAVLAHISRRFSDTPGAGDWAPSQLDLATLLTNQWCSVLLGPPFIVESTEAQVAKRLARKMRSQILTPGCLAVDTVLSHSVETATQSKLDCFQGEGNFGLRLLTQVLG